MKLVRGLASTCALLLASTGGLAQEPAKEPVGAQAAPELETWVEPVPVERTPPAYPPIAMKEGREGWVALSFIVTKDGAVTDLMVEDSSGDRALENSALAAVKRWRYTPATRNGEPADHPMTRSVIRFMQELEGAVSKDFKRKYNEIAGAAAAGDLVKAQEMLTEFREQPRRNISEEAWLGWLSYTVLAATKTNDRERLLGYLGSAVGYETEYLPPDVFLAATSRMFLLRVQKSDLGGALDAYERLTSSKTAKNAKDYERVIAALDKNVEEIRQFIAGPATLANDGFVGSHDYWVHSLARRSFGLSDVQGSLQALEVRCKHHTVRYEPVTDQHTWTVPASWEKCGVYVHGAPGAYFKFYEYPDRG